MSFSDALIDWLKPIQWQAIAALTFPRTVGEEAASRTFSGFVNEIERDQRGRICTASAMERRSRDGEPVPLHIHAAIASLKPITTQLVSDAWNHAAGRPSSLRSDLALVERYDPSRGGLDYLLKQTSDPNCHWDIHNVEYFNPKMQPTVKADHTSLRSARRWSQQVSVLSRTVS
jgi:hypothetical protein